MVATLQYVARPAIKGRELDGKREVEKRLDCGFSVVCRQETQLAILETARRAIYIVQDYVLLSCFSG